uniref:YspA cpYpsA-related SLOG domain-containing protein n=1 Tax=viral metagenome TaxID=1070528 RepID=A0A6M3JAV1_9ZZZZ
MTRLAIVGSRTFNDYDLLIDTLSRFSEAPRQFDTLISGGAKGADSIGERWATSWGIEIVRYLPEWKKYGKSAGFIRNQTIVDNCDMVLAFWDGKSSGTADTIEKAKKAKKPTFIIYV